MNRISFTIKRCVFVLVGLLFGWSQGAVNSQEKIYAIADGMTPNQVITIDPITGAGTLVGSNTNNIAPIGLGFKGNKLYTFSFTQRKMLELDPFSATDINPIDVGLKPPFWTGGALTFRSDGIGFLGMGDASGKVYTIDLGAGTNTPINTGFGGVCSLAFNSADVLYGIGFGSSKLFTIDQVTGATTLVGNTGIVSANLGGLAFDASGNLFVLDSGVGPSTLYKVDPVTAVSTKIGNVGFSGYMFLAIGTPGPALTPGVTITQSGGSTNVTEGGATDSYTVVLNTAPTANVTITLNPGTQVTVAPATLTFTPANWNVPQTVTVTAVDDALVEGPHTGTITHTSASGDAGYNAIAIASVTANITDNDVGPPPPPPPPAVGGGAKEGNYSGSQGLANGNGGEGTFGFGRQLRTLHPFLKGPHRDPNGTHRVLNVAHQQPAQATVADSGLGVLGWGLLSLAVLAPAVLVYGRRRPA